MSTAADQIAVVGSKPAIQIRKGLSARTRGLLCVAAVYLAVTLLCPRPSSVDAASWRQFGVFVATLAGLILQPLPAAAIVLVGVIAAVVLGGTSLLGGRGNLAATAVAALFLSQLDQFVLALGVSYATRTLVQAAALAVGVALYSIHWRKAFARLGRRPASVAPI